MLLPLLPHRLGVARLRLRDRYRDGLLRVRVFFVYRLHVSQLAVCVTHTRTRVSVTRILPFVTVLRLPFCVYTLRWNTYTFSALFVDVFTVECTFLYCVCYTARLRLFILLLLIIYLAGYGHY